NTWTVGTNDGTFMGLGSDAAMSPVYVMNHSSNYPPANTGTVQPFYWYDGNSIFTITAGSYMCNTSPNNITISVPEPDTYQYNDHFSCAQHQIYRFLYLDRESMNDDTQLSDYFES